MYRCKVKPVEQVVDVVYDDETKQGIDKITIEEHFALFIVLNLGHNFFV